MKKLISVLAALAMAATAGIAVSAVGETMNVAQGTPVIDGQIDEIWATAQKVDLTYLKAGDLKANGMPEGLSASARVLWDANYLYFLCEITDDDFCFTSTAGDWKNDSMYIYIDELNLMTGTWQLGQSQNAFIPAEDLSLVPRNGDAPEEYEMKYTYPTENTCIIEIKYNPSEELVVGYEFGLDFQYNDADANTTRPYCLGWSDETDGASGNSNVWGVATLIEGAAADAAAEEATTEEAQVSDETAEEATEEAANGVIEATEGFANEGADMLFDGDETTKWCLAGTEAYVIWKTDAVTATGYEIVTANDNAEYPGRNPGAWTLSGSNDGATWTAIDVVEDDNVLVDANFTPFTFAIDAPAEYSYYKLEVSGVESGTLQISGLNLLTGDVVASEPAAVEEVAVEEVAVEETSEEAVEETVVEEVVVEEVVVEETEETVAPQTSDVTTVLTLAGMISALCAFVVSRKKANA